MKRLFLICAVAIAAAACSTKEPGPEFSTFPEISNELSQPEVVTDKDKVTVTADVKNKYGSFSIFIYYRVDNERYQTASQQNFNPTEETVHYKGWIPAQPAGSNVQWVVRCYNTYSLMQQTEVKSYVVAPSIADEQ